MNADLTSALAGTAAVTVGAAVALAALRVSAVAASRAGDAISAGVTSAVVAVGDNARAGAFVTLRIDCVPRYVGALLLNA